MMIDGIPAPGPSIFTKRTLLVGIPMGYIWENIWETMMILGWNMMEWGGFHKAFRFWPRILEIICIMNHHMGFNN